MQTRKTTKMKPGGMTAFHAAAVAAAAPAASASGGSAAAASGGRISKKLADAIAVRKAARSMSDDDDDDNNDDDDADAAAAAADAAAARPIAPYFGATGDPTARATSLPPLPGFDAFRGANLPPLLSTAVQSTAAAAALPPGRSRPSGSSGPSGSVLSFFNTNIKTPSIRRTTNTTTTPSIRESELLTPSSITTEGEEYGGLGEAIDLRGEGEEVCLPAISTVWECAYINYKVVNGKDGWECQWCGLSFKPRHATRAMRHGLKLKGGDIAICKGRY